MVDHVLDYVHVRATRGPPTMPRINYEVLVLDKYPRVETTHIISK